MRNLITLSLAFGLFTSMSTVGAMPAFAADKTADKQGAKVENKDTKADAKKAETKDSKAVTTDAKKSDPKKSDAKDTKTK